MTDLSAVVYNLTFTCLMFDVYNLMTDLAADVYNLAPEQKTDRSEFGNFLTDNFSDLHVEVHEVPSCFC